MIPMTPLSFEQDYCRQLMDCFYKGVPSDDRTGVGTIRKQHAYFEWEGIALLRGKKQHPRSIVAEALWMLSGLTDLASLEALGCGYWKQWAKLDGTFGRIYGAQFRDFGGELTPEGELETLGYDQLKEACRMIVEEPNSRRILVSLWNPRDLKGMALPPCHLLYQFCVVDGIVHMHVTQRSADAFIGVPADFTLFSIMLQLICLFCNRAPGKIHYTCNDFHIYRNHEGAVLEYAKRMVGEVDKHYAPIMDVVKVESIVSEWLIAKKMAENYTIDSMLNIFREEHEAGRNIFNFDLYQPMSALVVPVAK